MTHRIHNSTFGALRLAAFFLPSAALLLAGCGTNYRPTVTPISTSGPAAEPQSYAVTVSVPSATTAGVATVIDFSGDSILAQAPIGVGPLNFSLDETGSTAYTYNSDGTLATFPVSSNLQAKNVNFITLATGSQPLNYFTPAAGVWIADKTGNAVDTFTGYPPAFKLSIPVANNPISVIGSGLIGQRDFAISQGNSAGGSVASAVACNASPTTQTNGEVDGIEISTDTASSQIPVGKCPVFGVMSADGKRLFILNRGDDTISVINVQNNSLDNLCPKGCVNQTGQTYFSHPVLPLSKTAVTVTGVTPPNGTTGMGSIAGPVYAEYNTATSQLIVSNYDGGTVSIIDVSEDIYGNDSQTFGTTYTVPVGNNPASVTVLYDGSRAYTANQADGTVSIINIASHTIEKTLSVVGSPRSIVSTQNSSFGKVYVSSPNSPYLTILRTDLDIVDTTVLVEGNILDVRVSTQNASSGNSNVVSRVAGWGQPCYLPGSAYTASATACQTHP